jgi:hypothetical protein
MPLVLFDGCRPFDLKAAVCDVLAGITLAAMDIPQVRKLPLRRTTGAAVMGQKATCGHVSVMSALSPIDGIIGLRLVDS